MALTKETKAEIYARYLKILSKAQGMVVTEYRGMRMKDLNAIRNAIRPIGGGLTVAKSTIFRIALRESGFAAPEDLLSGPIAVAITNTDLPKLTKTLMGTLKDQPLFVLKGAILGKTVFSAGQIEALSTMPTLEEARASLIGTITMPASQLVGLLGQPGQQVAQILKAYTDKQQGGESAA